MIYSGKEENIEKYSYDSAKVFKYKIIKILTKIVFLSLSLLPTNGGISTGKNYQ